MNATNYGQLVNDSPKAEPARKLYPVARPHNLDFCERDELEDYFEYLYILVHDKPAQPLWWNCARGTLIQGIEQLEMERRNYRYELPAAIG